MNHDINSLETQQTVITAPVHTRWQRVTFEGLTPGDPPYVTLQAVSTTHTGIVRHFTQAACVLDDNVLLRFLKLAVGTEIRVCMETDWNAPDIPVTLKDFCCVEAAAFMTKETVP